MAKVIGQLVPNIWEALYGKGMSPAFNDGFTYFIHDYTGMEAKIVRTK